MSNELTDEQKSTVYKALNEPFDPEDISWKPQTVNYRNGTAMAVAYAAPRAYIDRLNEVVGPGNWSDKYTFTTTPFKKLIKGKRAYGNQLATEDRIIDGNKVLCVCEVHVNGMGTVSSTGDVDASDENAATSAEAQAFKRACIKFGLGRYLYDLPKQELAYDKDAGKFNVQPQLPDWAVPQIHCEDCGLSIQPFQHGDQSYSVVQIVSTSKQRYQKKLCVPCQRKRNPKPSAEERVRI